MSMHSRVLHTALEWTFRDTEGQCSEQFPESAANKEQSDPGQPRLVRCVPAQAMKLGWGALL